MSEVKVNKISPRSGTDVTLGDSGDTFTIPSGATLTNNGTASGFGDNLEWQSAVKTTAFTAVSGEGYWVDTTSGGVTVTLPSSAAVGDQIILVDFDRTFATNAMTINRNSHKFQGGTENPVYDTSGQTINIVYSGTTNGWIPISDDDVANEGVLPPYSVDFLVIAGGGGGAKVVGGGGGAGGYRNSFASESSGGGGSSETALALNIGTTYTVTVGAGGTGGTSNVGTSGVASSISGSDITSITSIGGGFGGSQGSTPGNDGGSGGGGAGGGTGNNGDGTANQGFNGGQGNASGGQECAGGGGGASAVGSAGSTSAGGNGGNGLASSITGSAVTRAGGAGGSGRNSGSVGSGGSGGGGNGGVLTTSGTAGTVNTGSGGGGSHDVNGLAGGSGVVVLRMATANYSGTTSGSPTVTTSGSDTILLFNASGSYTG